MASKTKGDDVGDIAHLLEKTDVKEENTVTFRGQGLKLDNADDAKPVIEAIQKAADLQVLELCGNTIGEAAAKVIAEALKNRKELERCLWADMFTGRLRSEIPPSLMALGDAIIMANAHLVEVDLSDNAFGPIGIQSVAKLLQSEAAYTLEVLKFNNNGMGIGGKTLSETLIQCHKNSSAAGKPLALKVFIAGRNRLENLGAISLAEAFETIGTLEEIQMPQNGINHEGISALAEAVKNCPNLKHLNLNDNTFSEKGAVSMAEAIRTINSLEIINFGDCLVRTEGAVKIGEALKSTNPHLKHMILSFGEIELDGAIKVCEGMTGKEQLELLDLNGNQFGQDGVDEIKDMMKVFGDNHVLGSLSEDEGVDSDGNEDDDDEDDDDECDAGKQAGPFSHDDGRMDELRPDTVTSEDFPDKISAASLLALDTSKRAELLQQAVLRLGNDPEGCVDDSVKIAGLLDSRVADEARLEATVFECADVYLRAALQHCQDKPMRVVDRILVRAGLIKCEDKTVRPPPDVRPFLRVITHMLTQPYYPQTTKKVVRAMVAKTCKVWEKNYDLQGQLLKILY